MLSCGKAITWTEELRRPEVLTSKALLSDMFLYCSLLLCRGENNHEALSNDIEISRLVSPSSAVVLLV